MSRKGGLVRLLQSASLVEVEGIWSAASHSSSADILSTTVDSMSVSRTVKDAVVTASKARTIS